MKITVCELPNRQSKFEDAWSDLAEHIHSHDSDLVLLPEMPFHPWFAITREVDLSVWDAAVDAHDDWLRRLTDLAPAIVLGSRPANIDGRRINEGFVWESHSGYRSAHQKYHLPDEEGFWEATWYEPGDGTFSLTEVNDVKIGFQICTDMWFMEHARSFGREGSHIIAVPRATPSSTRDKWLAGGQTASVVSGAFCISSSPVSDSDETVSLGGFGWIIDPDGMVLATTSEKEPFITVEIDLEKAELAKETFPRYVNG